MYLFRIGKLKYLEDLSGTGASFRHGGRWNLPGIPALYLAQAASVAMLEMANYLASPRLVPKDYRLGVFEVQDDVRLDVWSLNDLPAQWRDFPYPRSTQRMGTQWLIEGSAPLLAVPTAAVPGGMENIVLASPARLDRGKIRLHAAIEDIYGPRTFAPENAIARLTNQPSGTDDQ